MTLQGSIVGSIAGVSTELKVEGKYTFNRQQERITWMALGIDEQRAVGLATPGLRVQARLRLLLEPAEVPHLESPELETILTGAPAGHELLEYRAPLGGLAFAHDRHWHLYLERDDLIVFRRIEEGRVVAQCNVKRLPPLGVGQNVPLEQFRHEIQAALGSAAQQVVDAQESQLPSGLRQLRVALVGQVATAPVQWIYYQLCDADGRRVTCVFTMSGEDVARFGAKDVEWISGLTLSPADQAPADPERADAAEPEVAQRPADGTAE
jgi:hypothetical protein